MMKSKILQGAGKASSADAISVETRAKFERAREAAATAVAVCERLDGKLVDVRHRVAVLTALLAEQEATRLEIVAGVARGTHQEDDLVNLRVRTNALNDDMRDLQAILDAFVAERKMAGRTLDATRATMEAEKRRIWREVNQILYDRHREQVQAIMEKLSVAVWAHSPGVRSESLFAGFQLRMPLDADARRIREELSEEFDL